MSLFDLLEGTGIETDEAKGIEIRRLTEDSREVKEGDLYLSMYTASGKRREYAEQALQAGAIVLGPLSQLPQSARTVTVPSEEAFNRIVAQVSSRFYGKPSTEMKVVGITGTNGKTTTALILKDMLTAVGIPSGYLGTLGFFAPGITKDADNTTPTAPRLQRMLSEARDAGVKVLSMEVSSHALADARVDGVQFDVGVFTNLTQDHLDFHGDMTAYELAKKRLFTDSSLHSDKFVAAINVDDETGRRWAQEMPDALTYGRTGGDLKVVPIKVGLADLELTLSYRGEEVCARVGLGGAFNVINCASAAAAMLALGFKLNDLSAAFEKVKPVPGRFEPVLGGRSTVIVDYAHTPDALSNLLHSVREVGATHITAVIGCGGDRDRAKRPLMVAVTAEYADRLILTEDNPRYEPSQQIFDDMVHGADMSKSQVIPDRREAIREAISKAAPGSTVVIAGKGHEKYQLINGVKLPFDDVEEARKAIAELG